MGAAVSRHHRFPAAVRTNVDPELGLIEASSQVTPLDVRVNLPEPSPLPKLRPTRTIKSSVNLKKQSLRLKLDKTRTLLPGQAPKFQLAFELDALEACKVTAYVLGYEKSAKAGAAPGTVPTRIKSKHTKSGVVVANFGRGLAHQFEHPPGTGLTIPIPEGEPLLSKSGKTIYPLVIRVETVGEQVVARGGKENVEPQQGQEQGQQEKKVAAQVQTTFATLVKQADGSFEAQVAKQVLWAHGTSYVLHEIFGIDRNPESSLAGADDAGNKECVICLTEIRDTLALPCRHLCMCADCAKALRYQTNKCPICRCVVESLLVIRVSNGKAGTAR
ncbi:E3 ubiquitin-protein ligase MGRN1 [Klebsormidium nitens]|uniref:RING-type E3 ubiquitin transferase n=1 Tax=Klebsormidium nitens TaxID=105231 RepID=A0A1Y1IF96_KLENI|nr:E3 ubiquitin-protein ligase MGRN1 [Klebsormidium nitens]|eukprot:GAQ87397.1 E3 ubiquitin-protein ligase MGRN1 [Klebsormidium nitens]